MAAAHTIRKTSLWLGTATLALASLCSPPAEAGLVSRVVKQSSGAPTLSGKPAPQVVAGSFYDFTPVAKDPNGDPLTFSAAKLPKWAAFNTSTGRVSGTPSMVDAGKYQGIRISVSDGKSTTSMSFSVKVLKGSTPSISGTPPTSTAEGASYAFAPTATDADGQKLSFAVINKPSWASFSTTTGQLSGTPPGGSAGTYSGIGISVTDGASTASLPPFAVTVNSTVNHAPTISGSPVTAGRVGVVYDFRPSASDADGNTLRFSIVNKPTFLAFDTASGRLTGTPPTGSEGNYPDILISVTDGKDVAFLPAFTLSIAPAQSGGTTNTPPTITGTPSTSVSAGSAYSFTPTAVDPDGQTLAFGIANKPSWATFSTTTGRLSGTPSTANAGSYANIVISVSDGVATATLPAFSITVAVPNRAPTISGSPATSVTTGQAYSFTPTASDPDGQALTFSISNKPSWASFSTSTGRLSGTPAAANAGTFAAIVITASDGSLSASLPAFSITVTAANRAPTISGTPATSVNSGQAYAFTPTASDPEGQPLTFSIANKPAWASFSASTGRLSGTPAAANAGTYSGIVITASDGSLSASLPAFSIAVAVVNRAPTISGTPSTSIASGQAYSFTPTASDPDGQTLAFGIANKPSWATFSTTTGRLSGTPTSANAGTYSNIVISVSDGSLSATLPAFAITVTTPVTGVASLTWSAPTLNADGTALTNLAGYKVRYGTSPGSLTQVLDVPGAAVTGASIEGLAAGTWYFTVSSYNNTGVESAQTSPVSYTVQ